MNRVVVTGMGVVTPIGVDVPSFERNMFAGASGVQDIRGQLVDAHFPVPFAALVDANQIRRPPTLIDFPLGEVTRFWLLSAAATNEAVAALPNDAKIDGIVYGTAEGVSFEVVSESLKILQAKHSLEGFDWRKTSTESSLAILADMLEQRGHGHLPPEKLIAINSACASGNQAIGIAFQRLRSGEWTRAIAGGVDARCTATSLMNFHMLGAVTTAEVPPATASRPFSKDRSGFVRGEGAGTLLLETLESARARGATIYGEILGSGNTCDAYRLTDGREDGASVVRAMRDAIRDARIETTQIDYINAHGTSTPLNDRLETSSIKQVFGERARQIPVSSLKSQIGHPTVAASAIEAIACLLMIRAGRVAPTLNLNEPDPECDLDYVPNTARPARITHALNNSFGFGGQNSCLVLKGAPAQNA